MAANNILSHVRGGRAFVRFNANATVIIGNSTVNSDIGNPVTDPIVGASITGLWWSTTTNIVIKRGANTLLVLNGTDHWNKDSGMPALSEYAGANVTVVIGDTNSVCLIELTKAYAGSAPPTIDHQ